MVISSKLPSLSRWHKGFFDRGAAAVEMALVLPLLLFLLMGIIDFGRAYSTQIQLSAAAREGVRLASLNTKGDSTIANYGATDILARVQAAAGGVPTLTTASSTGSPATCPNTPNTVCVLYCSPSAPTTATVVVTSEFTWITGISGMSKFFGSGTFPTPTTLQATGVMRCAG